MGMRIPQADLYFNQYTDMQLAQRAQQIHDALVANALTFPDLPAAVDMVTFLSDIVTYRSASAAALKGSKIQTSAKYLAKTTLINDMRQLALYVNTVILETMSTTGTPLANGNGDSILALSGFAFSSDPTPQANATAGIPAPMIQKALSRASGTLYILARGKQKRKRVVINTQSGRNMYKVRYRTSAIPANPPTAAVPAGPWEYQTFTNSSITVVDLLPGTSYDYQVAAIGGRNVKTNDTQAVIYTGMMSAVII